jgi:hypothetical protein
MPAVLHGGRHSQDDVTRYLREQADIRTHWMLLRSSHRPRWCKSEYLVELAFMAQVGVVGPSPNRLSFSPHVPVNYPK